MLITFEIVAEYEATLFACVSVEIDVEFEVAKLVLSNDRLLYLVDSWLLIRTWVQVEPIQVVITGVKSVVSASHSVRVY